jgi:hypothetical protein
MVSRRFMLAAFLPAILMSTQASRANDPNLWDGAWNGTLGAKSPWPISITISQGKVSSFSERGVPLGIRYTKITPTALYFGDQAHYSTMLIKTGDATASARIHGRHGFVTGALTRQ